MCGIAGVLGRLSEFEARERASAMAQALAHRGPDDHGLESFDLGRDETLVLAHRRLSIIDLTSAGHQPMTLDGRLTIAFNGEIYNYVELREELRGLGRRFKTASDTEVLLHAYDVWGEACLDRLNGMWSFALWDAAARRLFCAIDHSGIKPFYYAEGRGTLAFASEPKALLTLPWVPKRADGERVVFFLLSLLDHLDERTMFSGVRRLLPGHALEATPGGNVRVWRWWRPKPIDVPRANGDLVAEFRRVLRDSIRLRFRSDVPVGINLSGGVDSSSLVCTAADMAVRGELTLPQGLRTFTSVAPGTDLDEGPAALGIAERVGATAFTVEPRAQQLRDGDLDRLVWHQDEPFGNLSTYMQFCVMRRVRETGTVVVLSGQGPDELFSGYAWQYPYVWKDLATRGRMLAALGEMAAALQNGTVGWKHLGGYAVYAWAPSVRRRRYLSRVRPFLAAEAPLRPAFEALANVLTRLDGRTLFESEVERIGLPGLLRYEDRNSMAFSVESRLPYLDPRLLDLAYAVPSWSKVRHGWSKFVVRRAVDDVVPREVLWQRRKIGFAAPRERFMASLAPVVRDVFGSKPTLRSSAFVNADTVLGACTSEPRRNADLWRYLSLELWMRAFDLRA